MKPSRLTTSPRPAEERVRQMVAARIYVDRRAPLRAAPFFHRRQLYGGSPNRPPYAGGAPVSRRE